MRTSGKRSTTKTFSANREQDICNGQKGRKINDKKSRMEKIEKETPKWSTEGKGMMGEGGLDKSRERAMQVRCGAEVSQTGRRSQWAVKKDGFCALE